MSVATGTAAGSVWLATGPPQRPFPSLEGDVRCEVAVLGGGIVGITAALLLAEAGVDVVLLEADRLARGVTGHTTAKVTSQHGLIYATLRSKVGPDAARSYGEANEAALAWIADRVEGDGIDCDLRRQAAYAYVTDGSRRGEIEGEVEAAVAAGLPATLVEETPLPYPVAAAIRFDDQAEFHPRKYLLALAERLRDSDRCRVFERSRAVQVDTDERCTIRTPGGTVTADRALVATHYPFLDRSLAFARVYPQRSYAIACRIDGDPPAGMHISADSPTRSIREVPVGDERLLLVGGEGHKTGTGGDTRERYLALERFAREHWNVRSVDYGWSAQDGSTADGIPYVGAATPRGDRVLIATGFGKWGMTNGTAAARLLADRALGVEGPWARLFDPNRLRLRASAKSLVEENAKVALHFVGDRIRQPSRSIDDLSPGEGAIVLADGEKVAGFRDDDGELVAVSTRCTHLGCQVAWNAAERSWDCPCHGSRFAPDGAVLQGPAVHRLERRPLGS